MESPTQRSHAPHASAAVIRLVNLPAGESLGQPGLYTRASAAAASVHLQQSTPVLSCYQHMELIMGGIHVIDG